MLGGGDIELAYTTLLDLADRYAAEDSDLAAWFAAAGVTRSERGVKARLDHYGSNLKPSKSWWTVRRWASEKGVEKLANIVVELREHLQHRFIVLLIPASETEDRLPEVNIGRPVIYFDEPESTPQFSLDPLYEVPELGPLGVRCLPTGGRVRRDKTMWARSLEADVEQFEFLFSWRSNGTVHFDVRYSNDFPFAVRDERHDRQLHLLLRRLPEGDLYEHPGFDDADQESWNRYFAEYLNDDPRP